MGTTHIDAPGELHALGRGDPATLGPKGRAPDGRPRDGCGRGAGDRCARNRPADRRGRPVARGAGGRGDDPGGGGRRGARCSRAAAPRRSPGRAIHRGALAHHLGGPRARRCAGQRARRRWSPGARCVPAAAAPGCRPPAARDRSRRDRDAGVDPRRGGPGGRGCGGAGRRAGGERADVYPRDRNRAAAVFSRIGTGRGRAGERARPRRDAFAHPDDAARIVRIVEAALLPRSSWAPAANRGPCR